MWVQDGVSWVLSGGGALHEQLELRQAMGQGILEHSIQGCLGVTGSKTGTSQGVLEYCATGALTSPQVQVWSVLGCSAPVSPA